MYERTLKKNMLPRITLRRNAAEGRTAVITSRRFPKARSQRKVDRNIREF